VTTTVPFARKSQGALLARLSLYGDNETRRRFPMLIVLALILGIAWVLGFTVFHVASAAIHVLIVLAIASVVLHFIRGTRRTV
jgi:hypothetical protein